MGLTSPAHLIHRLAAALAAAVMLAAGLAAAAQAAPARGTAVGASMRIGRAPAIPAGASARGSLPGSDTIDATVALQPRNPAALTAFVKAVSTPGSPVYHHYLTVAQFAARFAPTIAQVASVRAALQAQGLHPGPLAANGLSFDVAAPAATMGHAFATSFRRYRVSGGRTVFANTSAPALPASVSGVVQGVIGLDSLQVPTPAGLQKTGHARPHAAAAGAASGAAAASQDPTAPGEGPACNGAANSGGYTAGQIADAYGLSDLYAAGDGGSGTTVALFELEPYSASDVAAYQQCYGTATPITNITVDGGPGTGAGQGEAALDVEDLIGLVPNASLLVYEGKNTGASALDTYRAMITQNRAKVISTSWGLCEPQEGTSAAQSENTLFLEAATQGQTVFAASSDDGVKDCKSGASTNVRSVDDPASQPYVTGVGGTSLTAVGPPPTETVWNSTWNHGASSGASGGGVSTIWGEPSYQSGIAQPQSSVTCTIPKGTSCREVPDVSADADIVTGYSIYYKGGWSIFGGTSAAAPTWGALAALANASEACTGKSVGFANPALYQAARTDYGTYFNDVTSGNNSFGGLSGFSAGPGYDMASGLGSPKGAAVASALCGSTWTPPSTTTTTTPAPPAAPVVTLTHPSAQTARVGDSVRVQLHATDSAGKALTFHATGLPAGLSVAAGTGVISGTPKHTGKSNATVTVTDAAGSSAEASMTWTVAGEPTVTGGLTVSKGRPELALKVGAGRNAPPIESIVVAPSSQVRFARAARSLSRGITVRNGSGHRIKNGSRLRGADLVVTLRTPAVRTASLRVTVPAILLVKAKKTKKAKGGKGRHPAALSTMTVTVTVTDAQSFRTAVVLR
ncbi:MAG TPA: protease pro-enzyme activation domain-containing protein [Solirubrobacteraceae bacterium]|nr:protease pro-enzyme activation domain-containing protein [Solirubrobacteraceae bacterium]